MIKSITFDVARTLIDISYQTYWRELSDYLVDQGIELYPQELKAAREYVFMVDLGRYNIDNWKDWCVQILSRLDYIDVYDPTVEGMIRILKQSVDNYELYDDVIPVFEKIEAYDLTFSCLTTIPEFKLRDVMKPIRQKLEHIIHGGNAGCAKGNPKMYYLDLKWKGVKAKENLFVGDDHLYDIEYPHRLGMTTIHIEREDRPKETAFSDHQISELDELIRVIEQLI